MKSYAEIKDIIVNQLGLRDVAAYKAYCDQFWNRDNPRHPTREEIDLLSPDHIDNCAFWQVADEVFQTDPVSNCGYGTPVSVEEANRRNLSMYHIDGFTGLVEYARLLWGGNRPSLLEIGPGYGAFKDWMAKQDYFDYYGADVRPRVPGVDQALPNGLLSEQTMLRRYAVVVASNVFQHLSVTQRRAYYRDIVGCLHPGGVFMVSMFVDIRNGPNEWMRDGDGAHWVRHYGQFTRIQSEDEIVADMEAAGFEVWRRAIRPEHCWMVLSCRKLAKLSQEAMAA